MLLHICTDKWAHTSQQDTSSLHTTVYVSSQTLKTPNYMCTDLSYSLEHTLSISNSSCLALRESLCSDCIVESRPSWETTSMSIIFLGAVTLPTYRTEIIFIIIYTLFLLLMHANSIGWKLSLTPNTHRELRNFPPFTKPKHSLQFPQTQHASGPYFKPDESSPQHHKLLLYNLV
jgi:hypothetical protein